MILDLPLERLRARRSVKWQAYGPDVLPLWVAEMDVDLAPPIQAELAAMVAGSDTGYTWAGDLTEAYAEFAAARWGLAVDPARSYVLQDVMRGVLEVLQTGTAPGDGVVINPPVYQPFFGAVEHAGRKVVEVPLTCSDDGAYGLDLAALEQAFADGARAYLLCSPHNPVGRVWSRAELAAVTTLCAAYDVLLVVDEIHAPLVYDGGFVPIHAVEGADDAVSIMSASKAWNLAGLKCALVVAGSERGWQTVQAMGVEVGYGTGILGVAGCPCGVPRRRRLAGRAARRAATTAAPSSPTSSPRTCPACATGCPRPPTSRGWTCAGSGSPTRTSTSCAPGWPWSRGRSSAPAGTASYG